MQAAKKNLYRMLLDLLLLLLLASLYRKQAISLAYHEIAGLVFLAFGLIHLWLQRRWLRAILQRITSGKLPARATISCVVDTALLLALVAVIGSGVLISKVLFSFTIPGPWKIIHYFSATLALLLAGIHTGLHGTYLTAVLKQIVPLPALWKKPLATVLLTVCFVFGGYTVFTSNFTNWLAMPFQAAVMQNEYGMPATPTHPASDPDSNAYNKPSPPRERGAGQYKNQAFQKEPGAHQNTASPTSLLQTMFSWSSVMIFFALLTHWCVLLVRRIH